MVVLFCLPVWSAVGRLAREERGCVRFAYVRGCVLLCLCWLLARREGVIGRVKVGTFRNAWRLGEGTSLFELLTGGRGEEEGESRSRGLVRRGVVRGRGVAGMAWHGSMDGMALALALGLALEPPATIWATGAGDGRGWGARGGWGWGWGWGPRWG